MRTPEENKVYMKEYYLKNKEKLSAKNKEYRDNNKEKCREISKAYREKNNDLLKEKKKQWYEANKEHILEQRHKYYQDNIDDISSKRKEHYQEHKDEYAKRAKEYRNNNQEHLKESKKVYYAANKDRLKEDKRRRANSLIGGYKANDIKYEREGFNLTQSFILDRIFASSCIYCDETDWHKLGCDRIDNNKAHTTDNVVCACKSCNLKRGTTPFRDFLFSQKPSSASDILSDLGLN